LKAGDTLIIRAGTYRLRQFWDDMITLETSGTATAWITIKGESGARPVLKGRGSLFAAVDLGGRSYVHLENLVLTSEMDSPYSGGLREGIDAGGSYGPGGDVHHLLLRDLEIHHVEETGLNLAGNCTDIRLARLNIHHTGMTGIGAPSAEGGKGWQRVEVLNCRLAYAGHFYQGREQDSPYDRPDGIGMEASAGPLDIAGCLVEHNRGDGVDSKCRNTLVRVTTIANNGGDSLKLWGDHSRAQNVLIYGDGDGDSHNGPWGSIVVGTQAPAHFEFVNVTVDDNAARENYPAYFQYDGGVPVTVLMRNCIIAHGYSTVYFGDTVTLTADHNLFYRRGAAAEPVVHARRRDYLPSQLGLLGAGNISAEPRFVRRSWGGVGDYHLQTGSPAIDTGTSTGAPAFDMALLRRPQGAGFDMGAYER
jgi:hypothetical protein